MMPGNTIPSIDLKHQENDVPFALRTMEEIFEKSGGNPDLPHRHNYYTILWSRNACGQHIIDYKDYVIEPNTIFFVNPGQVHQVITYGEPVGIVMMFTNDFLQRHFIDQNFIYDLGIFSDNIDVPPLKIDRDSEHRLMQITENIRDIFMNDDHFKMELIASYLKIFLIECNRHAYNQITHNPQTIQAGKSILRSFKQLLDQHYFNWHKVGIYANQLAISSDYLNNVIKSTIGKTAKELIQDRIIIEAKRLGIYTDLSNKEIAYKVGFDDPAHFSKFFSSSQGISFSEFRKSIVIG